MGLERPDRMRLARNPCRKIEPAVQRTREYLLGLQNPDGYSVGGLEADASVIPGYIPLMYWMEGEVDPIRQQNVVILFSANRIKTAPGAHFREAQGTWMSVFKFILP